MWETSLMLNEIEKQNVSAAIFKFAAWTGIIVGVAYPLVHFAFRLSMEFKSIAERLVNLL